MRSVKRCLVIFIIKLAAPRGVVGRNNPKIKEALISSFICIVKVSSKSYVFRKKLLISHFDFIYLYRFTFVQNVHIVLIINKIDLLSTNIRLKFATELFKIGCEN